MNCGASRMNPIYDLLRADGSIVINKNLITAIGLNESIMFCELLSRHYYFSGQGQLQSDGSFFNTIFDLSLATGLADKAQRTAINNLKNLGLLSVNVKGIPAKRYFKICGSQGLIESYLSKGIEKRRKLIEEHRENPLSSTVLPKAETCYPQEKELAVAEGGRNNTNYNTKSIIQNNNNGTKSDDVRTMSIKEPYTEGTLSVVSYYYSTYRRYFGEDHPNLKKKQIQVVMKNISNFMSENFLDEGNLEAMIDRHFERNHLDTDYNINHFATEGILVNLIFESGLH